MNQPQKPPGLQRQQRLSWVCLGVLAILAAGSLGDAMQVNERLRKATAMLIGTPGREPSAASANSGYSAVLQRQPIQGIRSPQGLSYNPETDTLFTVLEGEQAIAELDLCGNLLRRINIRSSHPLEEITLLNEGSALLSFANTNTVRLLELPNGPGSVDTAKALELDIREGINRIEIEEMAWDSVGQQLFLASKEYPPRIYQARFNPREWRNRRVGSHKLIITEWLNPQQTLRFMPDITALAYAEAPGELLLLSDETREIIGLSNERTLRRRLALNKGVAGLRDKVRSPEGMAFAKDTSLYLISDPEHIYLYRFYPEADLGGRNLCSPP